MVLTTRASLAFFVDMLFCSGVLELIRSSLPPITLFWGHETCLKKKTKVLGKRKNRSWDPRRRQKQNSSKARRKLWPKVARDRAYSNPYSCHAYFSWFSPFLMSGEDGSINARWISTRRTWLSYYHALEFPRKSFRSLWALGVSSFHWLAAYSVHIHPSKGVTCLQLFKRR